MEVREMIVNAYLKVTQKQWEDIKEKYVEPNMYHIVSSSKRKCKRCDGCSAYNPCTTYEGYCAEVEGLVDRNSTCNSINIYILIKNCQLVQYNYIKIFCIQLFN